MQIPKDTVLRDANGEDRVSYYIKEGVARLSYLNEEGGEGTLLFFGKGAIYPINVEPEPLTAEAYLSLVSVTDLEVLCFPAEAISDFCAKSKQFNSAVISHYVRYVNVLITKLLLNSYNDSTQLVSALLYLIVKEKNDITGTVELTQEQIGQVTGLSRTQVTRVLASLRDLQAIKTLRGRVEIANLEELKRQCSRISTLIT